MRNIELLDCTLRDGGYVNDWSFGAVAIYHIIRHLEASGINILELGFLRDEPFDENRTVFPSVEAAERLLDKKAGVTYSAMIEAFNPYPLDKLADRAENGLDLIRVCIWKRCLKEHLAYCGGVADKGYRITIQPSRVEQYSDVEFIEMLKRSNELQPYGVYVVDTWGTQSPSQICHYMGLADTYLAPSIRLGYHGHNNKLQAMSCVQAILRMGLDRTVCLDSSIMGMGRGAGNLNTELVMDYLNEMSGGRFKSREVIDAFNQFLSDVYRENPWGYSMYYYLSAVYGCNPNFAAYFSRKQYGEKLFGIFLESLSDNEKIVFDSGFVEERLRDLAVP